MDKHVQHLRRVAGLGDPEENYDPVGSLRAALEHGEQVAAAMAALDRTLLNQSTNNGLLTTVY
eukprot:5816128-Pyramimonas_sp.AAC.2